MVEKVKMPPFVQAKIEEIAGGKRNKVRKHFDVDDLLELLDLFLKFFIGRFGHGYPR
jgi:hypothetical protein